MSAEIEISPGGPMWVRGARIGRLLHDGSTWTIEPLAQTGSVSALCRCGRSTTMPMCDRPEDGPCFEELPPDGPLPGPFRWDVPAPGGPPAVALKPDGPARVAGDVAIVYDGAAVEVVEGRTSLCRCGRSRCQPLCDSSHRAAGLRDDANP